MGSGMIDKVQESGLSWYYHWSTDPLAGANPKIQFVPMIWGNWGHDWLTNPENKKYKTVLGFNEPDLCAREVSKILPSKKNPTVNFNFKYFPNASKTGFAFKPRLVRQTTAIRPSNFKMGKADLKLGSSDHDPWGEIEVVKVLGALFLESNNTMDPGEVVAEVEPEDFLPYSFQQQDWY